MATDFYGKELNYGDKIVFAGPRSTMREGMYIRTGPKGHHVVRITSYGGENAKPVTRTLYLDNRTGKLVSRYNHIKVSSHWVHADTGEKLTNEQMTEWNYNGERYWANRVPNPEFVSPSKRKFVHETYEDYLIEIEVPGSHCIVLTDSKGIIKL